MTIAVIGAGASGMMAALTAAETPENKILLFERQARVGRKLAVTGNGRCNLTNTGAAPENYHGAQPEFAARTLAAFPPAAALDWFAAHGLLTVTEPGGRVYRSRTRPTASWTCCALRSRSRTSPCTRATP